MAEISTSEKWKLKKPKLDESQNCILRYHTKMCTILKYEYRFPGLRAWEVSFSKLI